MSFKDLPEGQTNYLDENGKLVGDGSVDAEGLIGRTSFPVFDLNHKRLICKIKTKDF